MLDYFCEGNLFFVVVEQLARLRRDSWVDVLATEPLVIRHIRRLLSRLQPTDDQSSSVGSTLSYFLVRDGAMPSFPRSI